jgi:hypothetical protein
LESLASLVVKATRDLLRGTADRLASAGNDSTKLKTLHVGLTASESALDQANFGSNSNFVTVVVSPATSKIAAGSNEQFTATVTGDKSNSGVTWSVVPATGAGAIDAKSGVYVPPATGSGSAIIIATSNAQSNKSGSATVTF